METKITCILKKFVNECKTVRHANLLYQNFDDDFCINSSNKISKYQIWIRNGIIYPQAIYTENQFLPFYCNYDKNFRFTIGLNVIVFS